MKIRCLALLSGGLDSMLAVRLMQQQGIEVEALNFKTLFTCCQLAAGQAGHALGARVHVVPQDDDYLDLLRAPRFGYGRGANPCVDCRIYMFAKAKRLLAPLGAQFLVSGEVVGQRPMSQKRQDLDVIAHHSHCDDLLLRPLSARLLPPTLPEREGWVDRSQLHAFEGRSRKGLIALAKQLGIETIPSPSSGCALTEPRFAQKVFDLLETAPDGATWDFELLKHGRHFRYDAVTKVIVGRDDPENDRLAYLHDMPNASSTVTLFPLNFSGPRALLVGPPTPHAIDFAVGLIVRYSRQCDLQQARIEVRDTESVYAVRASVDPQAREAQTLATLP
jgi:hypothetical protein